MAQKHQKQSDSKKKLAEKSSTGARKISNLPAFTGHESGILVVGMGSSAGGLAALESFFDHMPASNRMAFVIVQHMDPSHKSMLSELLQRHTKMKVVEAEDGIQVEPECVYTIPPNKDMSIFKGALQLTDPLVPRGQRKPIDYFFRSLAEDQKENTVGIVFSGTGTEGTLGLKAIKGMGGLTIVQKPDTAAYDGMPRSAIAANVMDLIVAPEKIPDELQKYQKRRRVSLPALEEKQEVVQKRSLDKILMHLRSQTGNDFSQYKQNTVVRRIEKRMAVNQINKMEDYARYLQQNPEEITSLFRSIIIGVTNFFRDRKSFENLKTKVISKLLAEKGPQDLLRVWVTGCSSGEEAYSIAILIQECLDNIENNVKVNIFATDMDSEAIETARIGIYPESISVDVSAERLKRFFVKIDHHYKVEQSTRNKVVFATQNLIKDPPFSKLDLISCRNLLIYMNSDLQKKIFPLFHYSLRQDGYLFLGSSETIGVFSNLFSTVDRKWKIFKKKGIASPQRFDFNLENVSVEESLPVMAEQVQPANQAKLSEVVEKILLSQYAPAAVVINEHNDSIYFFGNTGKYLQPVAGEASFNIVDMARRGLKLDLGTAIRNARKENKEIVTKGIKVQTNGTMQGINLIVMPVFHNNTVEGLLLVAFQDIADSEGNAKQPGSQQVDSKSKITELEQELSSAKEYLQTTIEELETSNEELKSSNEELQSSNEELQSTNEELETSKEELQSLNEEMVTMNSELQNKIDALSHANDDLSNLMASTQIATVFLDQNLKIKRFTPSITKVIPLLHSDIGRPIGHFASTLLYKGWVKDIKKVLETLVYLEKEVQTVDKIWYNLRIMPYRTLENVIEGVVVTFFDISKQKLNEESLKRVHEHLNLIMHALPCIPYTATLKEHELTFVGSSAKAITGFDRNAFDDNKTFWMDNIHPEDKKLVMTALNKIKTDGYSSHKFRWKCSDGAYRRFINFVRKVRFFQTEPEILVGFWQDVSANQTST